MAPPAASVVVVVDEMFRGPPKSGNGGYVAGLLSSYVPVARDIDRDAAIEVTLRAPVPLGVALQIEPLEHGARLRDGEQVLAEASSAALELDVPQPPSWEAACAAREHPELASARSNPVAAGGVRRFHPICFCCSPDLAEDRGLGVQACPVPDTEQVAARWICHPAFAAADGNVPATMIWTALDCPGQMAWLATGGDAGKLLGRITARILRPVQAGEPMVITGWTLGSEGRKFYSGTALFNAHGELCACAKATWIAMARR